MRIAKLKSAYNSLIIGHRGLQPLGWESSDVIRFDLGPLFIYLFILVHLIKNPIPRLVCEIMFGEAIWKNIFSFYFLAFI